MGDKKKKMKFQLRVIDWTAIGSMMSVVALIMVLVNTCQNHKTLKEMKTQREYSYMPLMSFSPYELYFGKSHEYDYHWINLYRGDSTPSLQFQNVGNGPAVKLKIMWDIDRDTLEKQLYNNVSQFLPSDSESFIDHNTLEQVFADSYNYDLTSITDMNPVGEIITLELPLPIIWYINAIVYNWKENGGEKAALLQFPFTLVFLDKHMEEHKSKYILEISYRDNDSDLVSIDDCEVRAIGHLKVIYIIP